MSESAKVTPNQENLNSYPPVPPYHPGPFNGSPYPPGPPGAYPSLFSYPQPPQDDAHTEGAQNSGPLAPHMIPLHAQAQCISMYVLFDYSHSITADFLT